MIANVIRAWYTIIEKFKGVVFMAGTLIQFREDEIKRIKATEICERLGVDLPTYMRICLARLIEENGFPFSMTLSENEESAALKAMKNASRIAEENGIDNMTIDEINAEIAEARKQ